MDKDLFEGQLVLNTAPGERLWVWPDPANDSVVMLSIARQVGSMWRHTEGVGLQRGQIDDLCRLLKAV